MVSVLTTSLVWCVVGIAVHPHPSMLNRQCHGPGRFRDPYLLKAATRVARASCGTWPGWTSRSWLLLAAANCTFGSCTKATRHGSMSANCNQVDDADHGGAGWFWLVTDDRCMQGSLVLSPLRALPRLVPRVGLAVDVRDCATFHKLARIASLLQGGHHFHGSGEQSGRTSSKGESSRYARRLRPSCLAPKRRTAQEETQHRHAAPWPHSGSECYSTINSRREARAVPAEGPMQADFFRHQADIWQEAAS